MTAFTATLWRWEVRREAGWAFVTLPPELSDEAAFVGEQQLRRGFGAVRVEVRVGATVWRTSVFPGGPVDGSAVYVLPVKQAVRKRYGLEVGDEVTLDVEVLGTG